MEVAPDIAGADRPPAHGLRRLFFRTPAHIYRGPIASELGRRCIVLLTTTGRRTGRRRRVTVSFLPLDRDRIVVLSAWGRRSAWFRNVLANPNVGVRIGHDQFRAAARLVDDRAERAALVRRMEARSKRECGPPPWLRPMMKWLFDYEADVTRAVALDGNLPVVELTRLR